MKKIQTILIITMMLLTMVGSALAQTSYVTGSFTLGTYSTYIDDDRKIWFDDTQNVNSNSAVRDAFFEANGIFDCTIGGGECDLTTTLQAEVLAASVSTAKESQLRTEILAQMTDDFDCLQTYYTGSTVVVGSDTYFNTIKPCYVRLIKDHGILEEIFHDEPDAWFLVQKIQAIQTDLQHILAMEDQEASLSFSVGLPSTPITAFTLTIEPGPSANTYVINLNSAGAFNGVTNVQFAFVSDVANDYTGGATTVTGDGFLTGSVEQVNTNDASIAQGTIQFPPSSSNLLTATITSPLVGTDDDEFLVVNAFNVYDNGGIIGGSNDNIAYFLQGDLSQTYITINDEIFGQGMSSSANPGISNINFPTFSTVNINFGPEAASSSANILFPFIIVPTGETISFTSPAGTSTIGTVTNTVSNVDIILIGAQGPYQVNDEITATADNVLNDGDIATIAIFAGTKDASDSNNFVIASQENSGISAGSGSQVNMVDFFTTTSYGSGGPTTASIGLFDDSGDSTLTYPAVLHMFVHTTTGALPTCSAISITSTDTNYVISPNTVQVDAPPNRMCGFTIYAYPGFGNGNSFSITGLPLEYFLGVQSQIGSNVIGDTELNNNIEGGDVLNGPVAFGLPNIAGNAPSFSTDLGFNIVEGSNAVTQIGAAPATITYTPYGASQASGLFYTCLNTPVGDEPILTSDNAQTILNLHNVVIGTRQISCVTGTGLFRDGDTLTATVPTGNSLAINNFASMMSAADPNTDNAVAIAAGTGADNLGLVGDVTGAFAVNEVEAGSMLSLLLAIFIVVALFILLFRKRD